MEHLETIVEDKTREIRELLKEKFPEIFSEGEMDFDTFRTIFDIGFDVNNERYRFTWNGKNQVIKLSQTPSKGTLRPDVENSVNWDSTKNIYIEGENQEVLKLLQKSYHNKVDLIYIDPPYNKGKNFVYKDNFHEPLEDYLSKTGQTDQNGYRVSSNLETSGRFHTDWLNMIYPRLRISRNLLVDNGIICISIDDDEITNLRKICDEIFGEENYLQQVVWQRHAGGGNDSKFFAVDHEYILVYAKNKSKLETLRVPMSLKDISSFKYKDKHFSELGPYKLKDFRRLRPDDPRPGLQYVIRTPDGTELYDEWKWEVEKFEEALLDEKVVVSKNSRGQWSVMYKIYLKSEGEVKSKVPRSLLNDVEMNSEGKKQLTEVFGLKDIFNNPKPLGLISYFISMVKTDGLVLDFFAGSSSTAHAVIKDNIDLGHNRNFIMIQLPEEINEDKPAFTAGYKNISEISVDRIRRVIDSYVDKKDVADLGFRKFNLASSNFKKWSFDSEDVEKSLIDLISNFTDGRTDMDIIYEIMLKYGVELCENVNEIISEKSRIYSIGNGKIFVILSDLINEDSIDLIMKYILEASLSNPVIIFKDNGFSNDNTKLNSTHKLKTKGFTQVYSI